MKKNDNGLNYALLANDAELPYCFVLCCERLQFVMWCSVNKWYMVALYWVVKMQVKLIGLLKMMQVGLTLVLLCHIMHCFNVPMNVNVLCCRSKAMKCGLHWVYQMLCLENVYYDWILYLFGLNAWTYCIWIVYCIWNA